MVEKYEVDDLREATGDWKMNPICQHCNKKIYSYFWWNADKDTSVFFCSKKHYNEHYKIN